MEKDEGLEGARREHREWQERHQKQILMLVNASAQEWKDKEESLRLLQEARKVAKNINDVNERGFTFRTNI